jgi:hypothetical protein
MQIRLRDGMRVDEAKDAAERISAEKRIRSEAMCEKSFRLFFVLPRTRISSLAEACSPIRN